MTIELQMLSKDFNLEEYSINTFKREKGTMYKVQTKSGKPATFTQAMEAVRRIEAFNI